MVAPPSVPIGVSDFRRIRADGKPHVDKTAWIGEPSLKAGLGGQRQVEALGHAMVAVFNGKPAVARASAPRSSTHEAR